MAGPHGVEPCARRFGVFSVRQHETCKFGGSGGIRTHGPLSGPSVFKTDVIGHSTTLPFGPPGESRTRRGIGSEPTNCAEFVLATGGNLGGELRNRTATGFKPIEPLSRRAPSPSGLVLLGAQDGIRTHKFYLLRIATLPICPQAHKNLV